MSRKKPRRQRRPSPASLGAATVKYADIVLAEGENKGAVYRLYGIDDQDVTEARAACAAGCPNEGAFLVVYGLFQVLGLEFTVQQWSVDEVLDLFAMVGLPIDVWVGDMDADLARLLSGVIS